MPTYWDDQGGTRRAVTPEYYDDIYGVRHTATGAFRRDTSDGSTSGGGVGGTVTPPVSTNGVSLGMYPGAGFTIDDMKAELGVYPMVASNYYQIANVNNIVSQQSYVIKKGVIPHIAIAPKDSTNYPTGALTYMKGLVDGTTVAVDFFKNLMVKFQSVAKANPNVRCTIFPLVESDVQFKDGNFGSITATIAGGDPTGLETMKIVGQYHQAFYELAATDAPACERGLWIGGYYKNYDLLNAMFGEIKKTTADVGPDRVGTDPYNNGAESAELSSTTWETATETWTGKVNAFKTSTGPHNTHWVRWGKPQLMLTETGISSTKPVAGGGGVAHTDTQMAAWISQFNEAAATLGLDRIVYFNASGPNGNQRITGGSFPKAIAAMAAEMIAAGAT